MMAMIFAKDARLQKSIARDEIKSPASAKFPWIRMKQCPKKTPGTSQLADTTSSRLFSEKYHPLLFVPVP